MEYTKQNFKSGQILTAEALNNMDSSLESAVNELNNKQEKITDGSIPLSALSDEIKNKLGNDKYKKLNWYYNANEDVCMAESQTNKIIINEKEYNLTDEPVGITVNDREYGFQYTNYYGEYSVIAFGSEGEEYIDMLTNNVFILNEAPSTATPDWNAQEGEAGYIENRTHFIKYVPIPKNTSVAIDASLSFDEDFPCLLKDIIIECRYHDDPIYRKLIIPAGTYVQGELTAMPEESSLVVTLSLNYDYGDILIEIINDDNDYDEFRALIYNVLDDKYLSDTVIKTTPQTLSNTDKNQALANLGIDPVVWKYMCEPLVIRSGESVPEELIGTFNEEEGDRYNIKYPYKNMYVVTVGSGYKINPINANNIAIAVEGYVGEDVESIESVLGSAIINENKKWLVDA